MVELGVTRSESGRDKKRSSAARDLPEAAGPVIKRDVSLPGYVSEMIRS
jgi:hypothetical protein